MLKRFRFRLEALLNFRKMQKEQAQAQYAAASNRLQMEQQVLVELRQRLSAGFTFLRENLQIRICIDTLCNGYIDRLKENIELQQEKIRQAENRRLECLKALQDAESNLTIIEKLRDKRVEQYRNEVLRDEQKLIDEIGMQMYVRGNG